MDRNGKIVVADATNTRIQIFSIEGEFLTSFQIKGNPKQLLLKIQENK